MINKNDEAPVIVEVNKRNFKTIVLKKMKKMADMMSKDR